MCSTTAPTAVLQTDEEIVEGLRAKTRAALARFDPDAAGPQLTALEAALAYQLIFGPLHGCWVVEPARASQLVAGVAT